MKVFDNKTSGVITSSDLKKPSVKLLYWLGFIILGVTTVVVFFPPLWVILSSVRSTEELFSPYRTIFPRTFEWGKLVEVWQRIGFARFYMNSLIVVAGSAVFAIVFNGLFAYSLSKVKPAGHKVAYYLVLWSLMIPPTVGLIPLFINITRLNLINNFFPLWALAGASAFNVILYKNFYDSLPTELLEAARIDGAGEFTSFWRIVFPLSKPINMVILIFAINAAWSDFLVPFLVLNDSSMWTVMVRIFHASTPGVGGLSIDEQLVALTFAIIPPVIIYLFLQKRIMEGVVSSGIKG